jgi:hypothetical protein
LRAALFEIVKRVVGAARVWAALDFRASDAQAKKIIFSSTPRARAYFTKRINNERYIID